MRHDYCIIGGGILGLATAVNLLQRRPGSSLILLEKEKTVGQHQTGHNSGVIHAGIYYAPGSLKARLCREGCEATKDFCAENSIPFEACGKLLVATNAYEEQRMIALHERARENGIAVERLGFEDLRALEPNISGIGALLAHATGIVDYKKICQVMARRIQGAGGEIRFGALVKSVKEKGQEVEVRVKGAKAISASKLVACAGLQADRLARLAGLHVNCRIVPFRGEYYQLPPSKSNIVRHLIYPIPDPDLPFLGIHLTRMIEGGVTVGPNAVLGFSREGYRRFSFNLRDTTEILSFSGFWRVAATHWKSGLTEFKNSILRRGYLEEARKYCPLLEVDDLQPYPAGIRAQAILGDGTLCHDFLFGETPRMVHVLNAPSPAATSALPIARMIADRVLATKIARQ